MVAVVIVCHGGEIEIKTSFLIYTLKKYLKGSYKLYVSVPRTDKLASLSETTRTYFKKEEVEIRQFHNKLVEQRDELIPGDLTSNKIYALQSKFEEDNIVFLDSDIALLQDLDVNRLKTEPGSIRITPANRANVAKWKEIYHWAGQPYPAAQITTTIDQVVLPPYYNSGVICLHRNESVNFCVCWEKFMGKLWDRNTITNLPIHVFHRDQIALSLTLNEVKLRVNILDETLNFPIRSKRNYSSIYFAHYHVPYVVYNNTALRRLFREFLSVNTPFKSLIANFPGWKQLFHSQPFLTYCRVVLKKVRNTLLLNKAKNF